jgi:hypothetical protein
VCGAPHLAPLGSVGAPASLTGAPGHLPIRPPVTPSRDWTHCQVFRQRLRWSWSASMNSSRLPLNSFERLLFWTAILLGATLILCRVGALVLVSYLHHVR